MKRRLLLAVLLGIFAITGMACNGASLDEPTNNPLPGSGTEDIYNYEDISANYALDILPEREIPDTIPIEDPVWEPRFVCFTAEPTCIDDGCMYFELTNFDFETRIADFHVIFFNPNADNSRHLTIFMVMDDFARGICAVNPDGYMKLDEFEIEAYPFFAFNAENNGEHTPEMMYCYFERDISFLLDEGSDFFVDFELVPHIDQHDISVADPDTKPVVEQPESEAEPDGRTGGSTGDQDPPGGTPGTVAPPTPIAPAPAATPDPGE